MSEQGDGVPRRALPPRDDEGDNTFDDDSTPAPRRGRWAATGPSADPVPSRALTPIPPPAVLPEAEHAPASAGRRFSAVDLHADEVRPLPRRSALSPTATRAMSPHSADEGDDPVVPGGGSPASEAPAGRSYRRFAIGAIAALVVAAVVIAAFVLVNGSTSPGNPGGNQTPSVDPVATYLVQAEDLASVRADTTWEAVTTVTQPDASTPAAKCLVPVLESEVQPTSTLVRTFSPTAGAAAGLLHQVETYASDEEAAAAYAARATQLGTCERNTAWAQSGEHVTGLADEATGAVVVLQGEVSEFHTIIVSRTGTRVNTVDATQADEAMAASSLLPALEATYARQCSDAGTCPATPEVTAGVPPVNDPAGYLTGVDLPRITAGAGSWRGTAPTNVTTLGSRCEAVDLRQAPAGAVTHVQRTLVLQDDAAAPPLFGIDEVLVTYATPEEANAFVASLSANIDDCANRTGTAEVARTGDLAGPGTGPAWVVTRKVDEGDGTARFRVAALAVGNHAVYLMANPSPEFDFSDEAWHGVALRAAERLTQLP